ncbi:polysaccharide biosynthesis tyrosine autokinase [candidate division GN15 bacterium]|nr:polysaccharide biosynthesis tyrosine autokinase [candidate division GN15 bacterium]
MKKGSLSIIDYYSLESPFATEFRRLLQRLKRHDAGHELKVVMITSANLSEGKSTICALMSITAAKKGIKTLLVDTDLRRPTVHKLFNVDREPGLTGVLENGLIGKNVVRKSPLEHLDLITAGRPTAEAAEVFDAPAIGRLLTEMKFYYDLIIVDCAPIIPVSDPMLLAPEVDGVLMVVRAGQTSRDVATRAVDIMRSNKTEILGVVLNNANNTLPYYYDYKYYGYNYAPSRAEQRANKHAEKKRANKNESPQSSGSGSSAKKSSEGPKLKGNSISN